jgi:hypothetical protein
MVFDFSTVMRLQCGSVFMDARELYLVFAHNNSYEIKLAVAVTPTISSAPSTRFQQQKSMR